MASAQPIADPLALGAVRPARRLSRDARREQLVDVAVPIVARQGFTSFSLDDVAATAGVSRNLLYHYFDRGRPDLVVEVVCAAQRQLSVNWALDDTVPLRERVAANFALVATHSLGPTDAWVIHRRSRASAAPEIRDLVERFDELAVSGIAQNQLGTSNPPALARLALRGYVAFAETVLDQARTARVSQEQVMRLLGETLTATISAVR
jgi:AcrR family transcriptional regulator